jgi:hypothetical protein
MVTKGFRPEDAAIIGNSVALKGDTLVVRSESPDRVPGSEEDTAALRFVTTQGLSIVCTPGLQEVAPE